MDETLSINDKAWSLVIILVWRKENSLLCYRKVQNQGVQKTTPYTLPTRHSWYVLPGYLLGSEQSGLLRCRKPGPHPGKGLIQKNKKMRPVGQASIDDLKQERSWSDWSEEGVMGSGWWHMGALLMGKPCLSGTITIQRWPIL